MTFGPTPAAAAARVLWASFDRSIASRSVDGPGMRRNMACRRPRPVVRIGQAAGTGAPIDRPFHAGISAMTCSIVGIRPASSIGA